MRRLSHTKNFSWGAARWLGAFFFQVVSGIGRYQLKYFSHFFRRRVGQEDINCSFFLHFLGGGWDRQISIAGFFLHFLFRGRSDRKISIAGVTWHLNARPNGMLRIFPRCVIVYAQEWEVIQEEINYCLQNRIAMHSLAVWHIIGLHFTGTEILRYYILQLKLDTIGLPSKGKVLVELKALQHATTYVQDDFSATQ